MRARQTPEKIAAVAAERAKGRPVRDVAKEFGVSPQTVQNWTAQQRQLEAARAPKRPGGRFAGVLPLRFAEDDEREPAPPETNTERLTREALAQAEPAAPLEELDTLSQVKQMFRESITGAKDAQKIGHSADAQRFGRIAAVLVPVIARLERDSKADEHTLRISRQEIAERRLKVRQRFRAICDRPLLCSACSRKLSVFWGTGKTEEELPSA